MGEIRSNQQKMDKAKDKAMDCIHLHAIVYNFDPSLLVLQLWFQTLISKTRRSTRLQARLL
jgi:hypothetical protein